ncbi:MAG TPA: ATP-binding protein [Saprospiraceae bacterium]|nr:ATP-binding protein [Saprospiraceae bacterium]HMQ84352.1 ATP-binding protein [Saprospiraceae bacterium]
MPFVPRTLSKALKEQAEKYPVLALTGPRQSGKTTLLREMFQDYTYVSLENLNDRLFAKEDPVGFLNEYPEKVIFDEAQQAPQLFSYIQGRVDERRLMGQYILSGSQNFHLLQHITQSLAGRVALFRLLPFDFSEMQAAQSLADSWTFAAQQGFYPAIFDRGSDPAFFYYNYIQTYIERDVSQLEKVKDLRVFRNFLSLCAGRAGQLLNYSKLANESGISIYLVKEWLSILESSYLIFQLPPYFKNFNKRIVKTPKLYFYDTGLLAFLLGSRSPNQEIDPALSGSLFENMVIAELHKQNHHRLTLKEFFFWRDSIWKRMRFIIPCGQFI